MSEVGPSRTPRSLAGPFCALAVCLLLWPALITFDAGDWPSPNQFPHHDPTANACGPVGAWLAYHLRYLIGDGAFPLLLFGTLAAGLRLIRGRVGHIYERGLGLALLIACTSASSHLISGGRPGALPVGNGGLAGYALGQLLQQNLDHLGTLIVLAASFFVGLLFTTEGWVLKLPGAMGRMAQAAGGVAAVAGRHLRSVTPLAQGVSSGEGVSARESAALLAPAGLREVRERGVAGRRRAEEESLFDDEEEGVTTVREAASRVRGRTRQDVELDDEEEEEIAAAPSKAKSPGVKSNHEAAASADKAGGGRPAAKAPIVKFLSPQQVNRAEPYPRQIANWQLPPLALLEEPSYSFTAQQEQFVREQARILERTLEEFRIDAQVVEIDTGPVITMFELRLGAGIKVSQIASLSNDIARALKAHAIRVVAPISGKNTIGIEVPNTQKETVRLRELMTVAGKRASEMALPLFLGKDASGQPLVSDLAKMPHLLIAGTTGSGKSVCLNTIILSLLMTQRPDHVKMILIDPKMVELSQFKDVPHLMCPIVTDMPKAERILEWAVTKMDERYELLAEARVKHITAYNRLGEEEIYARFEPESDEERARIPTHLPYVVVVIDELADLMMTSGKEVEHHLSRLAQKSRAVGIHIIVATQRPEVRVVTGLIKSNLPCRICFRVASRMDSRIVMDQNGGEVLLGQGDMLFLPPGSHKLMRAQGTYLEDGEVQAVLEDLADRAKPEFHPELLQIKTPGADDDSFGRDPLFNDAVRIVLQSKRGSVSLLQRKLTIGYSRASRLIEQMGEAGIVGDYKGSQAREVMLTLEEWDALRRQVEADQAAGYAADEPDEEMLDEEEEEEEEDS